jgi:hypothetical protein
MPHDFRRHCHLLRLATGAVALGLFLLVALGMAGPPMPSRFDATALDPGRWWLLRLVVALPAVGYLWALWSAQRALGDLAAGRTFQPTVSRAMRHIGAGVLAGALIEVFAMTNLMRLVLGGTGSYLFFNLSAIVLGVVGAALVLLARLVDEARAMQVELDEIF